MTRKEKRARRHHNQRYRGCLVEHIVDANGKWVGTRDIKIPYDHINPPKGKEER